jgi:cation:H+ antiporter
MLILFIGSIIVGLTILYFSAEWLVRGAAGLALHFGIRPMVVGLTVVALGTSMPEFLVNVLAALSGSDGLAIGNVVGSNIANIGLILGVSAIIVNIEVKQKTLRAEFPVMLAASLLFYLISLDGDVSRIEGGIMVILLILFLAFLVYDHTRQPKNAESEELPVENISVSPSRYSGWKRGGLVFAGVAGLTIGARFMVYGSVEIAEMFEVSEVIIGLTILAIGTSLPELATSVVASFKGETELSVGNVLGSNIFNILFVVGTVSVVRPIHVEQEALNLHFPLMLVFSFVLFGMSFAGYRLSRMEGALLLIAFCVYTVYLIITAIL